MYLNIKININNRLLVKKTSHAFSNNSFEVQIPQTFTSKRPNARSLRTKR
jgi:hypothetical protein